MPRAKFLQMIVYDIFAVCLACAIALLMMYCSVKARQHTQPPHSPSPYNSSASAVCAIWLIFQTYVVHSFRAKFPQFQLPVVIYSIFASVSSTYAPQFQTMHLAMNFAERMLKSFLTGLALATGVSLFILPSTCREIVFKQMAGYIGGLRAALKAYMAYFESLERENMFGRTETFDETAEKMGKKGNKLYSSEAEAIMVAVKKVRDLHGKLHGDITFAKREFALGYLGADDIQSIFKHLRQVMTPVVGLSFVVDIFQRLSEYNKWNEPIDDGETGIPDDVRQRVVQEWHGLMQSVHAPFQSMIQTIDEGLQHVTYVLKMGKPPKKAPAETSANDEKDVESANATAPGERGFAAYFEKKITEFKCAKQLALSTWCEERGVRLPPEFFAQPSSVNIDIDDDPVKRPGVGNRSRRQLYLFLYVRLL